MISDEMRELLSAYVDGELRGADEARVEDLSKRDPELRREIEAYRKVRTKLRDWDEAEHGAPPRPTLLRRAVARAHTLESDRHAASRGRRLAMFFGPVPVAAALLLVSAAGLYAARQHGSAGEPVREADAGGGVKPAPPLPFEDLRLEGSALLEAEPVADPAGPQWRLLDELPSRRARELVELWRRDDERWDRLRERAESRPETRTGSPTNLAVAAMVRGYAGVAEPLEGLVLVNHPRVENGLPLVRAVPEGSRAGIDQPDSGKRILVELSKIGHAVLAPLGEVWVGAKDPGARARVVTAASWIEDAEFVPIVWADEAAVPPTRHNLEVQEFILGPEARRALLGREGRDVEALVWLRARYGADLVAAFAHGETQREQKVKRLLKSLASDVKTTGFAVLDDAGAVLGVELFASHELMMAFAERLLHGYLLEAGDKNVRLAQAKPLAAKSPAIDLVTVALEGVPERAVRVEEVAKGTGLREGMQRVNLRSAAGGLVAHGLLDAHGRPIHLTIFGS